MQYLTPFFSDPYDRPQKWGWAVVIASWIVLIPVVGVLSSFGTIVSSLTEEFNATKFEAGEQIVAFYDGSATLDRKHV